jgi:hypothetical protein
MLKITHDERTALLATDPATYSQGWDSGSTAWVLVQLEMADPTRCSSCSRRGGG